MAYFEELIPSKYHYFTKFKDLSELDLKIIFAMTEEGAEGPRNVSRIAEKLNESQQTVNYRVTRFDREDLVRFRAIADESTLGLESYAVIATVKSGLAYDNPEGTAVNAGTFLTCYPVWRLLMEVHGGAIHGFFALYSIPHGKEDDLRTFFDELKEINCILRVDESHRVTQSRFNKPPLKSYLAMVEAFSRGHPISFDWRRWGYSFDEAAEAVLPEENLHLETARAPFSYEDLLVLSHLETNLREKFVDIAKAAGRRSSEIAKRYERLLKYRIISGCRSEIYPINPKASLHLSFKLDMVDKLSLRKLVSHLDSVPYPITYQKVVKKNMIFLHTILPPYEFFDFHKTLELLSVRYGIIRNMDLYVSTYYSKAENVRLYEAFSREERRWSFTKEEMTKALHRLVDATRFKF